VNLNGQFLAVERRIQAVESTDCAECAGRRYWKENEDLGFCTLYGSKSQCDRAEGIRHATLMRADVLASHGRGQDRDAFEELRKRILRCDDAAWWVEHKHDAITMMAKDIEL
jgi:hypothetical protein